LYEEVLELDPNFADAWVDLGRLYMNQALSGLRPMQEGYELAEQTRLKALSIDPDNAKAIAALGYIAKARDADLVKAAGYYQRALSLEPTNFGVISSTAGFLPNLGRLDEAIQLREYLVSRDPLDTSAHYNLALIYGNADRPEEMARSLRTALRLSPDQLAAHTMLGIALLQMGKPAEALAEIQQEPSAVWRMIGLP
jgi:tetratricopeptide (TPR) repeat protein